jgi:hypothetical protein
MAPMALRCWRGHWSVGQPNRHVPRPRGCLPTARAARSGASYRASPVWPSWETPSQFSLQVTSRSTLQESLDACADFNPLDFPSAAKSGKFWRMLSGDPTQHLRLLVGRCGRPAWRTEERVGDPLGELVDVLPGDLRNADHLRLAFGAHWIGAVLDPFWMATKLREPRHAQ